MLPVEQRAERLQSETMCNSHFLNFLPPNQIIFLFCQDKLDAELDAKILSAFEDDDEAPRCPISPGDFRLALVREHGEAFQSSGFRCRGGGIPGDLPLAPNAAHVRMCVSSSAVFSLSNFSHPGGFNGEFA